MQLQTTALWLGLLVGGISAKVAELSSSIIISGQQDYALQGNRSHCTDMVDRAAYLRNSRLNFVPTLFWVSQPANIQTSASSTAKISHFCARHTVDGEGSVTVCPPMTQKQILEFTTGMKKCFTRAADHRMNIAITPHLEDATGSNIPRNQLSFNPQMQYNQLSYVNVMLEPLAVAMKGVLSNNTKLWFAMQGGMGASMFQYPRAYLEAMAATRSYLLEGLQSDQQANVKLGISTNFNKLCGCSMLDVNEPEDYFSDFNESFPVIRKVFDLQGIQELYNSVDFIGVAPAAGLRPGFAPGDLEHAIEWFERELKLFGVDLAQLLQESNKELHWVDYGVGGGGGLGMSRSRPAKDATQAAKFPFVGMLGPYKQAADPWVLHAYNTSTSPVRDYASFFYNQTVQYLWKQHEYKYQVDAAFLRNIGSWDVQAVHVDSTSVEGSYFYQSVVSVIEHHNERVQRLLHLCETLGEAGINFLLESQHPEYVLRNSTLADLQSHVDSVEYT